MIRAKRGLRFKRRYSHPVDRINTAVLCDQTVVLEVFYSKQGYPTPLRRVVVRDDAGKRITFLTNNIRLAPETIAELYRLRWQVELFFKWIKQHLRIKAFFGTSENAVKTQIWIAVATYVLIAIVKKRAALPHSLYEILQILSLTMFETTPINQLLTPPRNPEPDSSRTTRSPLKNVGTLLVAGLTTLALTRRLPSLTEQQKVTAGVVRRTSNCPLSEKIRRGI